MRENVYQAHVIRTLKELFPGCVILKNDSSYLQGVPDLLILWNDKWAVLEIKRSAKEPYQPNQEYYLDLMDQMSFAAMICPENEQEILNALSHAFTARRKTRVSQR